ncbi:hypothetical protein DXG01_004583 [Tephrocybe rancida]|nr:hypothetical protein DXG01_004583 [Tephrocybe rancida]
MPVFDGLFVAPHNDLIQRLLFECAHWHSLAKLRMHTDLTLRFLEDTTTKLGELFREFVDVTCAAYTTFELPRETEARMRKETRNRSKKKHASEKPPAATAHQHPASADQPEKASTSAVEKSTRKHPKSFNISTYKFHALADYANTIRRFGTSDSYSTEPGELEHRSPKARYRRTSRKDYVKQIARIERRQAHLRRIRARITASNATHGQLTGDDGDNSAPEFAAHHKIGKSENNPLSIGLFYNDNLGDPATKDFIRRLKLHLLPRIREVLGFQHGDEDDSQRVTFHRDRMYSHHTMRVNFTRYDVRRGEDIIRTGATPQSNVMMMNPNFGMEPGPDARPQDLLDSCHPFWYAQVLRIYHVNVVYIGEGRHDYQPRRLEFLWVRWYDIRHIGGWESRMLDQVELSPPDDEDSFAFLDPECVVRACHIIPCFALGPVLASGNIGTSHWAQDQNDYKSYAVNRDMMLRYHWQAGVGHTYSHHGSTSSTAAVPSRVEAGRYRTITPPHHPAATVTSGSSSRTFSGDCSDEESCLGDDGRSEHSLAESRDNGDYWDDLQDDEEGEE